MLCFFTCCIVFLFSWIDVVLLRSSVFLLYALCCFVHLASMGIFIGGLTALVPSRAQDITVMGGRALWTAFLATVLTGCIAGALVID